MTKRVLNVYVPATVINIPYFLILFFTGVSPALSDLFLNIFGISYWYTDSFVSWYVYWSMLFYLAYPLLFRFLSKKNSVQNTILVTALCAAVIGTCVFLIVRHPTIYDAIEIGFTRTVVFLIGCLMGKAVYDKKPIKKSHIKWMIAGAVLWLFVAIDSASLLAAALSLFYTPAHPPEYYCFPFWVHRICGAFITPFSALTIVAILKKIRGQRLFRFLKACGSISLELYLIHTMLARIGLLIVDPAYLTLWQYGIAVALSVPLSYFAGKARKQLVTKYTLRVKKKATQ